MSVFHYYKEIMHLICFLNKPLACCHSNHPFTYLTFSSTICVIENIMTSLPHITSELHFVNLITSILYSAGMYDCRWVLFSHLQHNHMVLSKGKILVLEAYEPVNNTLEWLSPLPFTSFGWSCKPFLPIHGHYLSFFTDLQATFVNGHILCWYKLSGQKFCFITGCSPLNWHQSHQIFGPQLFGDLIIYLFIFHCFTIIYYYVTSHIFNLYLCLNAYFLKFFLLNGFGITHSMSSE